VSRAERGEGKDVSNRAPEAGIETGDLGAGQAGKRARSPTLEESRKKKARIKPNHTG